MHPLMLKLEETLIYIKNKTDFEPQYGIILGTGLGGLVEDIKVLTTINYTDIPHFPVSTVESHSGKLIFGRLGTKKIVAMQGRFHYYEGYNMVEVTYPVRVLKLLGIEKLFISNAAGGLRADMEKGDLMIIADHINLHSENPLRGANVAAMGPRFPDMSEPYSLELVKKAEAIAQQNNYRCHTGVYASVQGPNLETKAEYVFLNRIGADAIGMSTVPEVIVAVHCGLPVFAISVITDVCYPPERVEHVAVEEVIAVAADAEPRMTTILRQLIANIP